MSASVLNNLTLVWKFSASDDRMIITQGLPFANPTGLSLSEQNFSAIIASAETSEKHVVVVGSPILRESVDREETALAVANSAAPEDVVKRLNGEFLVIVFHKKDRCLEVFTDRFSSYPVYWALSEEAFCLSYSYIELARYCRHWPGFSLSPEKAYEFFCLNRLMGTGTHDNITRNMPPAASLRISPSRTPALRRYWSPDYQKNKTAGKTQLVGEFADRFSTSIQRRRNPSGSTGIFLSGGHDSRLVASYQKDKSTCFTLSFHDNLEVACASGIAKKTGHDHVFCKLDPDFFDKTLDLSTELSGGLYATDNALFIRDSMNPLPQADVFLHGHGLDYMYQGMYVHSAYYTLFGRNTYLRRFLPFPEDMVSHFLGSVPIRMKYDLRGNFLNADTAAHYDKALYETVGSIYEDARTISSDPHDHWEYMILHQISKHHTFSNVLSKRTCGELRTPSLDNDLYDFYLRLPHKYRLHGDIIRGALYRSNPEVANFYSSNHGLPAGWGPYKRTAMMISRKLLRHATLNRHFRVPEGKDRTWPDRADTFREQSHYLQKALAPLEDPAFQDFASFIDWPKLKQEHMLLLKQPLGGAFLAVLLSYYSFYKAIQSPGQSYVRNRRLSA